jgi:hypothetical protein
MVESTSEIQTLPQRRKILAKTILAILQQFEADNPDVFVADISLQREDSYIIRNPIVWADITVEVK